MKKFFAIIAVAMFAISASAEVVWTETFYKEENTTYVDKSLFGNNWPYASQWFEKGFYQNEYTNVSSYSTSIRNKKVNSTDEKNSIGLYFGANRAAESCYVTFEGTIFTAEEGDELVFVLNSTEANSAEEVVSPIIAINDQTLNVADVTVPEVGSSIEVRIPLAAAEVTKLHFSFDNLTMQKFLTSLRVEREDEPSAIENVAATVKAHKVVENGQLVIIKNGVRYNAVGAAL